MLRFLQMFFSRPKTLAANLRPLDGPTIGVIAGNGSFPLLFCAAAQRSNFRVIAVCHLGETDRAIDGIADRTVWIKVGELGRLIEAFTGAGVRQVAMAGGINRVRLFGGVRLDLRGATLLARLRSTKDDVIMRGIAEELAREGIEVISCTTFMDEYLATAGVLTRSRPSADEERDIKVGIAALEAMSGEDIGQLVVVREGVIVAVEAVEGTDAAIRRGGELGGKGSVVVKCSKPSQDLRFDVPTIGVKTIETLIAARARVLAIEAERCLLLERERLTALADSHGIAIAAFSPLARPGT